MQPEQPAPTQNPYDFIINPTQQPKSKLLGNLQSPNKRFMTVGVGGLLILIILIFVLKIVLGGGPNTVPFVTVAQDQTEIARVAGLALQQQNAAQTTQNVAITIQSSLTTEVQQLTAYLKEHGVSVSSTTLTALKNTKTDTTLSAASTNDNYDGTFLSLMQTFLTKYRQSINTAYDDSTGSGIKTILRGEYKSAGLLLTQVSSAETIQSQP
jgi:hypothetical protein